MKTKNVLIGIFILFSFTIYAQSVENKINKTAITDFVIKTDSVLELKNFDWNSVRELFQENDGAQEISIAFAYENKSEIDSSKIRVNNFEFKVTGLTSDLENLIAKLDKILKKYCAIE